MTVYALIEYDYETDVTLGIYSCHELAEQALAEVLFTKSGRNLKKWISTYWENYYEIQELEVL